MRERRAPKRISRVLAWLIAVIIGAVYGTAATVAHAYTLGFVPVGLVLAIVGTGALLAALRLLTADRWSALAGGLGVVLTVVLFSGIGPGGSAIVAAQTPDTEWIPLAWTFAAPILVALAVSWPDVSQPDSARKLDE